MDFIVSLPPSAGKSNVMVIINRLMKWASFVVLASSMTAMSVAKAFFENVIKIHGTPKSIISDIDQIFLSDFWKDLFKLQGIQLPRSTPIT